MTSFANATFTTALKQGWACVSWNYIFAEIDKLEEYAGIDEIHFGYYRALANRFHQSIYYKVEGDSVVVWRVLDQRFNPARIERALLNPDEEP